MKTLRHTVRGAQNTAVSSEVTLSEDGSEIVVADGQVAYRGASYQLPAERIALLRSPIPLRVDGYVVLSEGRADVAVWWSEASQGMPIISWVNLGYEPIHLLFQVTVVDGVVDPDNSVVFQRILEE
jgi:hypothetical protein